MYHKGVYNLLLSVWGKESIWSFTEPWVWWIWLFHLKQQAPSIDDICETHLSLMEVRCLQLLPFYWCTKKLFMLNGSTLSNHSWRWFTYCTVFLAVMADGWLVYIWYYSLHYPFYKSAQHKLQEGTSVWIVRCVLLCSCHYKEWIFPSLNSPSNISIICSWHIIVLAAV